VLQKNFKHSAISVCAHSNHMQKLSSILFGTYTSANAKESRLGTVPDLLKARSFGFAGVGRGAERKSKPKRKRIALK